AGSRAFLEEQRLDLGTFVSGSNGSSEVFVARNGRLLGALHIEDELRPEAALAVAAMRKMGLPTLLLTGDVAAIAHAVGRQLGVDEVHAELLPEQKVAKIRALLAAGKRVAMIGDGINDAPALTQATIGVAMGA